MLFLLPEFVKKVLLTLQNAGYQAYAVGGCVRDLCRGTVPHDYDVATNAAPDIVTALFEHTVATGIAHGTVTVLVEHQPVEVTTFRTENGYSDSRHPDSVTFVGDLKEDLARRDFTVNAMAYDGQDTLVDPFCGKQDLQARILRAVGDPQKRFSEDALRILRLFRFAAVLDFSVEEATFRSALLLAHTLEKISHERIAEELRKALCGAHPERLLPLPKSGGLAFAGLFENPQLSALSRLPQDPTLRIAAGVVLLSQNPLISAAFLRLSNREKLFVEALLPMPDGFDDNTKIAVKHGLQQFETERFYARILFRKICGLPCADTALLEAVFQSGEPYKISQLAITGDDLKAVGLSGTKIGETLHSLCEQVIKNPELNRKETLLSHAKQHC